MNKMEINIEQTIKEIIAEIKALEIDVINISDNANFIEELNLDSFEVVNFVNTLDTTFNIEFGNQAEDFDSLKSWNQLLANIKNKMKMS